MGIYLLPVYAHPQTTSTQKDLYNLISIKGNSLLVTFIKSLFPLHQKKIYYFFLLSKRAIMLEVIEVEYETFSKEISRYLKKD